MTIPRLELKVEGQGRKSMLNFRLIFEIFILCDLLKTVQDNVRAKGTGHKSKSNLKVRPEGHIGQVEFKIIFTL